MPEVKLNGTWLYMFCGVGWREMNQCTNTDKSDYYSPVIPVTFVRKQKVDIMTA
jgi:hypothetical protein